MSLAGSGHNICLAKRSFNKYFTFPRNLSRFDLSSSLVAKALKRSEIKKTEGMTVKECFLDIVPFIINECLLLLLEQKSLIQPGVNFNNTFRS